jgi:hypothetical protein
MITLRLSAPNGAAIIRKLARLQDLGTIVARPLRDSAMLINNDLRRYPPISEANQPPSPPPGRFYTRGVGGFYVRKDGRMRRISTSQRLGVSWSTRYTSQPNLARAEITTNVTYAPQVHGTADQKHYHKRRGWQTVQMLFDKHRASIVNNVAQAVNRALHAS